MVRHPVPAISSVAPTARSFGAPRRRKSALRRQPLADDGRPASMSGEEILGSILRSALDLLGADQGFLLVSRDGTLLEIAGTLRLRPDEVMDLVLGRAARVVQTALRERRAACADGHGRALPMLDGCFEGNSPAIVGLPLDLGLRDSGVMCLVRRRQPRRVSDLDWEILQALTDQAALAIGAASHQTALTRLEASLTAVPVTL